MKINRENINQFYSDVNNKIDDFFDKGISTKAINRYFFGNKRQYGLTKFIKREGWEEVEGIKKIIKDVIEDRLDESKLMTFENYQEKSKGYIIFDDIVDTSIEKMIADKYRVSLGHIKNENNHIIISGLRKGNKEVYLFRNTEVKELVILICNQLYKRILSRKLEFDLFNINLDLKNKIDKETFINNTYSDIISEKTNIIETLIKLETGTEYKFIEEKNNIFIFEKV